MSIGFSVMQIAETDTVHHFEMRSERLGNVSLSTVERKNEDKNIATVEEWRSELLSPETNPVRKTVKNKKTVEGGERKGEDELTLETYPAMKSKTEEKNEDEIHRNIEETKERNQEHEKVSEERLTERFSKHIIGAETKRGQHSVDDTGGDLDTDTEVVKERRDDRQNPKTQTKDESRLVKTMLPHNTKKWKIVKTIRNHKGIRDEAKYETEMKFKKKDQMEQQKQKVVEEERDSELVARISLHEETRDIHEDEKTPTVTQKIVDEKGESERRVKKEEDIKNTTCDEFVERENEDHVAVSTLTLPLSTTSSGEGFRGMRDSVSIQTSSSPSHQYNAHPPLPVTPTLFPLVSSLPPTPHALVHSQLFPPSVTIASPTVPVEPVSLIEDLLTEVLESPGHHIKQNGLVVFTTNVEDIMVKNLLLKPAQMALRMTHKEQEINIIQPNESKFTPKVQESTPKPKDAKFIAKDFESKEPNPTPKSNEYKLSAQVVKLQLMENGKLTKPTSKTPLTRPTQNKRSKNKTIKSKEKKRKKDIKTQKPSERKRKKAITTAVHFPYFMDNYCPPECVCYGR